MPPRLPTLIVRGGADLEPILGLLVSLMPINVDRRPSRPGDENKIVFSTPDVESRRSGDCRQVKLSLLRPIATDAGSPSSVAFSHDPDAPYPFAGRSLITESRCGSATLSLAGHERVLAETPSGPVWTVAVEQGVKHFRSALPLPRATEQASFFELFNGVSFVDALPIIHFFRLVSGETRYVPPCIRASFVIDDPNLHRPRYGHVDYRRVVSHAARNNYHVCFATIPFDTWYTHGPTAELFKTWPERVSLLVHGNNHSRGELAARYTDEGRRALLDQAMRRMERFANATGVCFSKVMVPPHGACDHGMLRSLPECGFESACISSGSLRGHNTQCPWTRTLGYRPSEVIEHCPVLPRWGLGGSVEGTVLLAVYLGQAIVIMGHHRDLADDMGTIDRVAGIINGLGDVTWADMTTLSRLNYVSRREGPTLAVRAYGSVIRLPRDCDASELLFEPIATDRSAMRLRFPTQAGLEISPPRPVSDRSTMLPAQPSAPERHRYQVAAAAKTSPRLVLRRLITEARDRLAPYTDRLRSRTSP